MNYIKLNTQKSKAVFISFALLFAVNNAIFTNLRPVTMSSWYNGTSDPDCVPNACKAS